MVSVEGQPASELLPVTRALLRPQEQFIDHQLVSPKEPIAE
jgi:hypothetical protein